MGVRKSEEKELEERERKVISMSLCRESSEVGNSNPPHK